mmetsp:Transcript_9695/g.16316  ORF Transcript_9695/g.16316 Transcript_9695/m.16316 type:complete len:80 (-) Transcript_9695:193-432(-)
MLDSGIFSQEFIDNVAVEDEWKRQVEQLGGQNSLVDVEKMSEVIIEELFGDMHDLKKFASREEWSFYDREASPKFFNQF